MAYEGWVSFNGREMFNVARTVRLARARGVSTVRIPDRYVNAIVDSGWLEGSPAYGDPADFEDITQAPWYDAGVPESADFLGFVPMSMAGLEVSSLERTTQEYITDGGKSGAARYGTLPIVVNVVLIAASEAGALYGKRWLDRLVAQSGSEGACSGAVMEYLPHASPDAPLVHRRDVSLTRGSSVTRKKVGSCSATWFVTFTLTADDPFEYGTRRTMIGSTPGMGGSSVPTGPGVVSQGVVSSIVYQPCPVFDYSPIYDPVFPALVPSPSPPNFFPTGWNMTPGQTFSRRWVRMSAFEPTDLAAVPTFTLLGTQDARMIRLSIWPFSATTTVQCNPLFTVTLTYVPANQQLWIDGEQRAVYTWDGFSARVRRADSLAYGDEGSPVEWAAIREPNEQGFLVTLDSFLTTTPQNNANATMRAGLSLTPRSD